MPRSKPEGEGDFHVVSKRKLKVLGPGKYQTQSTKYQIYCNNVPFLKGAGTELSRREAQWIAGILNERCKRIGGRNLVKGTAA